MNGRNGNESSYMLEDFSSPELPAVSPVSQDHWPEPYEFEPLAAGAEADTPAFLAALMLSASLNQITYWL